MMGLIWYVQLVHYPGFYFIQSEGFGEFHRFHSRFTGIIVAPVMLTELGTSFYLFINDSLFGYQAVGFYLVVMIWLATALFSVPAHNKLSKGKDEEVIDRLVKTNWIRTGLWTAKAFLGLYLVI